MIIKLYERVAWVSFSVAAGDQKNQGTIHGFLLIAFFIFTQWLNWRYRFLYIWKVI